MSESSSSGKGRVLPGLSKVESMDPGMVISRVKKEVVDIGANDERLSEVVNIQGKSEY